jgi:hypothetical protein
VSKATQDITEDEAAREARIVARIQARFVRMRAEREAYWASRTEEQLLQMRLEESQGDIDPMTRSMLGLAVPMWIDKTRFWRWEYRQEVAALCQEVISHHQGIAAICDTEARGTARKGDLALCFNAIAQGLALLSFCPGGIVFAGHHWEAQTPEVPA